jgi:formate hydrogenlyase subunit 3/multisubunit Na+/H+ antiporter MnhD subunit
MKILITLAVMILILGIVTVISLLFTKIDMYFEDKCYEKYTNIKENAKNIMLGAFVFGIAFSVVYLMLWVK